MAQKTPPQEPAHAIHVSRNSRRSGRAGGPPILPDRSHRIFHRHGRTIRRLANLGSRSRCHLAARTRDGLPSPCIQLPIARRGQDVTSSHTNRNSCARAAAPSSTHVACIKKSCASLRSPLARNSGAERASSSRDVSGVAIDAKSSVRRSGASIVLPLAGTCHAARVSNFNSSPKKVLV